MNAEIRLERSREQNRQSSKKARIRRRGEEDSLKHEIESLQVGQAASAWEIFVTPIRAEPVVVLSRHRRTVRATSTAVCASQVVL
ncbi:unnamed protein product [Ectocarpus sp. 4 AP-2014]